ncbi:MAG: KR domain-containing protein [Candidatus Binataceae bacterium]|nr:KR domain-containing protein [Candidatus Binataceae bacterium]
MSATKEPHNTGSGPSIAVVGMAGRFPGARNLAEFWRNLRDGVESITVVRDEQLIAAGVPAAELGNPAYVRAAAILEDIDRFDAAFFGLSPKDAAIMDPQHRHFLECAWEALEHAGWSADEFSGRIGVYAGSGMNSYLLHNLLADPELVASAGLFLLKQTGNDKDVLTSRVSYQLNLTGPSLAVQTACSTSLVAIHLACQSLLSQECDMALAGGVTIEIPHGRGYVYREGEILSRDGHCRAFDAGSSGTIFGSGLGIVVLRRFEDAVADGDFIHAVIRGTAINNDGARKVGYLAPSVAGQAEAVIEALTVADVEADSISYIEAHGTGTSVGDPIEIAGLTRAFRMSTKRNGFCAIGSLKTNIGHLDAAAGVAGFIKTVLSLEHRQLPPSLNFVQPNPLIDFAASPFFVNTQLSAWESDGQPRRAGVTSLGIGGTNAHAILEEAPSCPASGPSRPWQVLTLSAKTPSALEMMAGNLASHLEQHSPNLADVAFTGHLGRKAFQLRRAVACSDLTQAITALRGGDQKRVISNSARETDSPVVFLCSGQGSQYVLMGRGLYESEPQFRSTIDFCADYLQRFIGIDLRTILFPAATFATEAASLLNQTRFTQPALFVIEYALAKLWSSWGIIPAAMIGHSIGELSAACIAGVFSLEAGLQIVAERGRLMQSLPGGSMTAVPLSETQVMPRLSGNLSLASVNSGEQCVISGPDQAIENFEKALAVKEIASQRLRVSHAFHSSMMDPITLEFAEFVRKFDLKPPAIPYISSATGTWITDPEATDPNYWAGQLRRTVRFADGVARSLETPGSILLELGPGNALITLCRQQRNFSAAMEAVCSLRPPRDATADEEFIACTVARMWAAGKKIDWHGFHAHERRNRLPMPAYPFERKRFWIEPGRKAAAVEGSSPEFPKEVRALEFFRPVWKRADLNETERGRNIGPWLIFEDEQGLGAEVVQSLRHRGEQCITVRSGRSFVQSAPERFEVEAGNPADYQRLLSALAALGKLPRSIVHLWSVCDPGAAGPLLDDLSADETTSFYSLLFLAQALGAGEIESQIQIAAVSNGLHQIADEPIVGPARALIAGPCGVISKELPNLRCRNIDIELPARDPSHQVGEGDGWKEAAEQVLAELQAQAIESPVAYRGKRRWIRTFEPMRVTEAEGPVQLKDRGAYLITGGLGGIGLVLAESLARAVRARLVLVSLHGLPPRAEWDAWLGSHDHTDPVAGKIQKIRVIEGMGAEVLVAAGDVCDPIAMRQVADQARMRFGAINGIIHAAGTLDDQPLLQKDHAGAARVLAPKVRGTLVLESVFEREPIDFFMLISSVSSYLAPAGQVDYTAANAFLDSLAQARSRRGHCFTSIQWPRWTDTGMASRLPGRSGARSLHPLLGRPTHESGGLTTYSTTLSLESNWIVSEHRLNRSTGLFPATGYLEMVRAAVQELTGASALSISDFYISQPLRVPPRSPQRIELVLRRQAGGYRFSVRAAAGPLPRSIEFASGEVSVNERLQLRHYHIDSLKRRCGRSVRSGTETRNEAQERYLEFGPRWRSVKRVWVGTKEALSLLELPDEFVAEMDMYRLHPALLDMATGSAMALIKGNRAPGYLYVPISYGKISIAGPLPATCYAYLRTRSGASIEAPIATFDITILDWEGNVVVEISEFSVRQIRELSTLASIKPVAAANLDDLQASAANRAAGVAQLSDAITSAEGSQAFARLLAAPHSSNVVIFPSDFLAYLNAGAARQEIEASKRTAAAAPDNSNDEVETTLTRWWQELLGVESVSSQDNFFDLGGNSLTGVRLLAKLNKAYAVNLKLPSLFEMPTIEKLARLVRREETATVISCVVPLRPRGSLPPLFVLPGAGGSVLAFSQLIPHMESDLPIYTLLYTVDESKPAVLRVEDLAAHYIQEMRKVQPEGPYYLLGHSFGGLVAFEMAQQLRMMGQATGLLGIIDTRLTNGFADKQDPLKSLMLWARRWSAALRPHAQQLLWGPDRLQHLGDELPFMLANFRARIRGMIYAIFTSMRRTAPKFLEHAYDVNMFGARKYRPVSYPGFVTLFRTKREKVTDGLYGYELGWKNLAGSGIEVYEIPGTHLDLVREPNVQLLAREVNGCLTRARVRQVGDSSPIPAKRDVG